MIKNRRAFYRHPYHYPVKIISDTNTVALQSMDVSFGGICVHYEESFQIGQSVRIEVPVSKHIFKMRGKVCYALKKGADSHFRIGIAFRDQSSLFMAKMAEEILCIQKLQRRMSDHEHRDVEEVEAAEIWIKKNAVHFASYFKNLSEE